MICFGRDIHHHVYNFYISMQYSNSRQAISNKTASKCMISCRSVKTKFIGPTHPAYVIATSLSAPHIAHLKQ